MCIPRRVISAPITPRSLPRCDSGEGTLGTGPRRPNRRAESRLRADAGRPHFRALPRPGLESRVSASIVPRDSPLAGGSQPQIGQSHRPGASRSPTAARRVEKAESTASEIADPVSDASQARFARKNENPVEIVEGSRRGWLRPSAMVAAMRTISDDELPNERVGTASLLTERQAADAIGVGVRTLQAWRYRGAGYGPRFVQDQHPIGCVGGFCNGCPRTRCHLLVELHRSCAALPGLLQRWHGALG